MEWHLMATVSIKYFADRIEINIIWLSRIIPLKSSNKTGREEDEEVEGKRKIQGRLVL